MSNRFLYGVVFIVVPLSLIMAAESRSGPPAAPPDEVITVPEPEEAPPPVLVAAPVPEASGAWSGGDPCGCHGQGPLGSWACWWHSCCDMPLHYPYFPAAHGRYYFRPYHFKTIALQQAGAASWGADPRNPYSNEVFTRIYRELEDEDQAKEDQEDQEHPKLVPPTAPKPNSKGGRKAE